MIKVGEETKLNAARDAALKDAAQYLMKQLLSPSSVTVIYSTVKAYVDASPHLSQMMTTRMTLAQLAYGWTPASMTNPATNADRARYLELVLSVIGLLNTAI